MQKAGSYLVMSARSSPTALSRSSIGLRTYSSFLRANILPQRRLSRSCAYPKELLSASYTEIPSRTPASVSWCLKRIGQRNGLRPRELMAVTSISYVRTLILRKRSLMRWLASPLRRNSARSRNLDSSSSSTNHSPSKTTCSLPLSNWSAIRLRNTSCLKSSRCMSSSHRLRLLANEQLLTLENNPKITRITRTTLERKYRGQKLSILFVLLSG